jgi:L-fuconolactonase
VDDDVAAVGDAGQRWQPLSDAEIVAGARFIIDHLGIMQPRMPPVPPQPWAELPKVLELARRPNAVIKVSGACTLSREPYPFPDIWDPLARVFDAWSFDRCLWGTD